MVVAVFLLSASALSSAEAFSQLACELGRAVVSPEPVDWRRLADRFLQLARRFPRSKFADDALFQAAYILYAFCRDRGYKARPERPSGNLLKNHSFEQVMAETEPPPSVKEALDILRRIVERYPQSDRFDDALYWSARILLCEFHDIEGAKRLLRRLRKERPKSEWLPYADVWERAISDLHRKPPLHWNFAAAGGAKATAELDPEVSHSGRFSLRLRNETPLKPHVYGTLWQRVKVKPNTAYKLRLWVKAKNARHCWFGGGRRWEFRIKIPDGTYSWRLLEGTYKTGPDETWFEFRVNVDDVTEALWIDDAEMVEVGEER